LKKSSDKKNNLVSEGCSTSSFNFSQGKRAIDSENTEKNTEKENLRPKMKNLKEFFDYLNTSPKPKFFEADNPCVVTYKN